MTRTLLLADDSVVIQKLVGLSFANEAIELITTDNGEDAITQAREVRPDLVLADVVMPGKSGYEVCEAIKQDPDLAHVPVLLLTGTFEAFDENWKGGDHPAEVEKHWGLFRADRTPKAAMDPAWRPAVVDSVTVAE